MMIGANAKLGVDISFFKALRIFVLLLVFVFVAISVKLNSLRATDWNDPIWIAVYPINGDGSDTTERYIAGLSDQDFAQVDEFMEHEMAAYRSVSEQPSETHLAHTIDSVPPPPPREANVVSIILWSLKLRWWSWRTDEYAQASPEVRIYMVYHDPGTTPTLRHSLGLKEGRIGVVYALAARQYNSHNNIVLAHELLHTLGASDKYDLADNYPQYPHGFAEPQRQPRLPQRWAEIMAGRVPISDHDIQMPPSLDYVVVGEQTALEIRWVK